MAVPGYAAVVGWQDAKMPYCASDGSGGSGGVWCWC